MRTIADAWDEVKQETFVNCFRHAGFHLSSGNACAQEEARLTQSDPELNQLFSQLNSDKSASLNDYLQVDNQVLPIAHLTTEDIIQRVKDDQGEDEEQDDKDGRKSYKNTAPLSDASRGQQKSFKRSQQVSELC